MHGLKFTQINPESYCSLLHYEKKPQAHTQTSENKEPSHNFETFITEKKRKTIPITITAVQKFHTKKTRIAKGRELKLPEVEAFFYICCRVIIVFLF